MTVSFVQTMAYVSLRLVVLKTVTVKEMTMVVLMVTIVSRKTAYSNATVRVQGFLSTDAMPAQTTNASLCYAREPLRRHWKRDWRISWSLKTP